MTRMRIYPIKTVIFIMFLAITVNLFSVVLWSNSNPQVFISAILAVFAAIIFGINIHSYQATKNRLDEDHTAEL